MDQAVPPAEEARAGGEPPSSAAVENAGAPSQPARENGANVDRTKEDRKEDEKRQKAVAAADKELLSWTRLSMSLSTSGIAAERGLAYIETLDNSRRIDPTNILHTLAICLVGLGIGSLVAACLQTWRVRRAFRRGAALPEPLIPLSLIVAVGVICIFVVALLTIVSFREVLKSTAGAPTSGWERLASGVVGESSGRWLEPQRGET
jgi:uncharacterized membrane protein YidH (DUF202 family)